MKPNTLYEKQVRSVLANYLDHEWIGKNSSLATPYFLGHFLPLRSKKLTPSEVGGQLAKLIYSVAKELWEQDLPETREELVNLAFEARDRDGSKSGKFGFLLLELYFFREYFPSNLYPQAKVEPIVAYTASSRTRFFGYLNHFVPLIASKLRSMVQPSFRLEEPYVAQSEMVGRGESLSYLRGAVSSGQSINLFGHSGVGKTSIASAVWSSWPSAKFWYSIRPKVNDNSQSLLFSLAHFLHLEGAPSLWHQLVSDKGRVADLNLAIGCLKDDLTQLSEQTPLFCFDEVDLLGNIEGRTEEQDRVLEILDVLGSIAPVIFIGQQAVLETSQILRLTELSPSDTTKLLDKEFSGADKLLIQKVGEWSKGNPRIIKLIAALYNSGVSPDDLTKLLIGSASTRPILERVWKRLTTVQKEMVGIMAVFRGPIPADLFEQHAQEVAHLIRLGLVNSQRRGNLVLDGHFPRWVSNLMLPEQLEANHLKVAELLEERGEFTESAWHYFKVQEFEKVIDVWYPFLDEEIENGRINVAAEFFRAISTKKLSQSHKEKLLVIRSEIDLLLGRAEYLTENKVSKWADSYEKATFQQNLAKASSMTGEVFLAEKYSRDAIDTLAKLSRKEGEIRRWRLTMMLREGDLAEAKSDIDHIKYQYELMTAIYFDHCGKLDDAAVHLSNALEVAELMNDKDAIAKIKHELAINFGRRGDMVHAEYYSNHAMDWYKHKGDRPGLEGTRANLAGMYLQSGEFEKVIQIGKKALQFFEKVKNTGWISSLSYNIAEAYYELNQLDLAQKFAHKAMMTEDNFIQPYALYTLGLVDHKNNVFEDALKKLSQGIDYADANNDIFIGAYLRRAIANLYFEREQIHDAVRYLEESRDAFNEMSLHEESKTTQELLSTFKLTEA